MVFIDGPKFRQMTSKVSKNVQWKSKNVPILCQNAWQASQKETFGKRKEAPFELKKTAMRRCTGPVEEQKNQDLASSNLSWWASTHTGPYVMAGEQHIKREVSVSAISPLLFGQVLLSAAFACCPVSTNVLPWVSSASSAIRKVGGRYFLSYFSQHQEKTWYFLFSRR